MSAHERQAYQRLLAAYHRRLQILSTCEKVLNLCGVPAASSPTTTPAKEVIDDPSAAMLVDEDFPGGFDDDFHMLFPDDNDRLDPHYFNRPPEIHDSSSSSPLESSSLSRLDICQSLCSSRIRQDITCRPYLGLHARTAVVLDRLQAPSLQNGDVVHVPFTSDEIRAMLESADECGGIPDCNAVAQRLRGRAAIDVRNAWIDHALNVAQPGARLAVYDEQIGDRLPGFFHTDKIRRQRAALLNREAEQIGEHRARIGHWISRQGYVHAECSFRLQLDDALNEIVTGPTPATSHLAVIVGSGNTREGAAHPIALDLRDKSTRPLPGNSGVVSEAAFSCDGRFIVTGSDDSAICLYDSDTFAWRQTLRTPNAVIRIAAHRAQPVFAVASSNVNAIMTVNAESFVSHSARLPFSDTVLDFAFGAASTAVQNHLVVGFQNQRSLFKYQLTSTGLRRMTQLPDENKVFLVRSVPRTASAYASCFLYSAENDEQLGSDKIKIWDARDPHIPTVTIRSYTKRGRHMIGDMAVSPDGRYLQTSGTDSCVCINDLRRLGSKPLLVLKHQCDIGQPTDGVATEWSRDSRFLVTGADDCTVRIWDLYAHDDADADDAGLVRVIDGNAGGEGCIHIVANIDDSNGFIYGTKLGSAVAFEQYRSPAR